jgi:beta-glucosidase
MEKYQDKTQSAMDRAIDLVDKMTIEEQASQLRYDALAIERLNIPAYNWWNESLHGVARAGTATMFPQAIGLAAMFDEAMIAKVASVCATEARAKYNASRAQKDYDIYKGLTMWSPNINIFRDPRWGRGQETFGECPFLTARLGVSFVKALQVDKKNLKVAACAKHYAVHSGPEAKRHHFDAKASKKDLEETYLPAFKALVEEANVESVMGAYNRVNGEPACASAFLMEKLKDWGFDGYFVSDCWAIRDFHTEHHITDTAPESAAMALKAGCDLNCGNTYLDMLIALKEKLISEDEIKASATRLMRTRARLGMLDESSPYDEIAYDVVACDEHKALSRECAQKSMVLLKNTGILPLDKSKLKSIGVIGPLADSLNALRGNYYGTADEAVTFLEGIQSAFDGRVFYSRGSHLYKDRLQALSQANDGLSEAAIVAQQSDVVVLCVGLDATLEGEEGDTGNEFAAGDKINLLLPESQQALVKHVLAQGKPTIIVNTSGSAMNVLSSEAAALIQAWYPGQMGGKAFADILFGEVSPSGKLPVTFYESADALADFEDYAMQGRTYRYLEGNVIYPFGYGLTYGKVICESVEKQADEFLVTVKNIGDVDTEDVVQMYVKNNDSKWTVKNHALAGFKRIYLKKGESTQLTFKLDETMFEVVDDAGKRFVDGSHFTFSFGTSQPDALSASLLGSSCIAVDITRQIQES